MIHRRGMALGLTAAGIAGPTLAKGGFKPLFDGKSLNGWTTVGDANWAVRDGAMSADQGAMSFLVSDNVYRDFDLRVEVWVSPDANSGIFIRCAQRTGITQFNAYEINLFDNRPDPTYGTGAIVDVASVSPMPKAGGRWNTVEISARGDSFSVVFNGQKTVDGARNAAHAEGPVALQYGAGVVKVRKVDIRVLNPTS